MTNTARADLKPMRNELQREIHQPRARPPVTESEEWINSAFADIWEPVTRNSSNRVKLKHSATDGFKYDYCIDDHLDYLIYTYLTRMLPDVRVRAEYTNTIQICWTNYVALYLTSKMHLRYDNNIIGKLTPESIYNIMKFMLKETSSFKKFLKWIGQIPELTSWGSELKATRVVLPLPFCYAHHPRCAWPVYRMKDKSRLVHRLEFVELKKLLRMRRILDDGTFEEIPITEENEIYLEKVPDDAKPVVPELYGKMTGLDDDEKKSCLCEDKIELMVDDFIVVTSKDGESGKTCTVDLDMNVPCKALSFAAVNQSAVNLHNYGNFTTNLQDPESGDWPMKGYFMNYGHVSRIPLTEMYHIELDYDRFMQPNFDTKGMAMLCLDLQPTWKTGCSTVVFEDKVKFGVEFVENAIKQFYTLYVILWVTKKLVWERDPKDKQFYNLRIVPEEPIHTVEV